MVGCFWQPSLVVIDTDTLSTLPDREFISGLAEVAKYGVIAKPELFEYLEHHSQAILAKDAGPITHIVAESCRAKSDVVAADERETTGLRAILNYGHTFAHALESDAGYGTYLHGEAVSIGMHMAAQLACKLGRVDAAFVQRQRALLENLGLPVTSHEHAPEKLWALMQHDKKVQHGTLRFILPDRMGMSNWFPKCPRQQCWKCWLASTSARQRKFLPVAQQHCAPSGLVRMAWTLGVCLPIANGPPAAGLAAVWAAMGAGPQAKPCLELRVRGIAGTIGGANRG